MKLGPFSLRYFFLLVVVLSFMLAIIQIGLGDHLISQTWTHTSLCPVPVDVINRW